jgi:hypothetical protein
LFFETGLLHLTWYPPIPSIYLQATCHISYSWVKLHCVYIYTTFSWSIHQL